MDIFVLDMDTQLNFTLEYADPVTLGTKPIVMREDFSLFDVDFMQVGASPSLILNPAGGCDVVNPTEDISWGAVKSLFR